MERDDVRVPDATAVSALLPGYAACRQRRGAVCQQIAYGKEKGVPWGISESGFYRFDGNQNYQYRAFGVPGLGFKRGLGDDLVIAPYASLMAIGYDPQAVVRNLAGLIKHNMIGLYGVYESIDFTADRLLLNETSAVVGEYMAHHQGMILMAMVTSSTRILWCGECTAIRVFKALSCCLQEQVPHAVPLQDPYAEDVKGVQRLTAVPSRNHSLESARSNAYPSGYTSFPTAATMCFFPIWAADTVPGAELI